MSENYDFKIKTNEKTIGERLPNTPFPKDPGVSEEYTSQNINQF